jgi:hypothetical protein
MGSLAYVGGVDWFRRAPSSCRLGAVPFFFIDGKDNRLAGPANALACGVMLAASFDLIHEGQAHGCIEVIVGMALGAVFIKTTQQFLHQYENLTFESLSGIDARKTLLVVRVSDF